MNPRKPNDTWTTEQLLKASRSKAAAYGFDLDDDPQNNQDDVWTTEKLIKASRSFYFGH